MSTMLDPDVVVDEALFTEWATPCECQEEDGVLCAREAEWVVVVECFRCGSRGPWLVCTEHKDEVMARPWWFDMCGAYGLPTIVRIVLVDALTSKGHHH